MSAALAFAWMGSDEARLNVVTCRAQPLGKLPCELPPSMPAANQQKFDVPRDPAKPLYPFGFGLSYRRSRSPIP